MRKFLLVLLVVAVPAIAANKFWTAFKFVFDTSPVTASLNVLKSINDPVYEEMVKVAPGFEAEYVSSFAGAFDFMTNRTPAPEAVFDRETYDGEEDLAFETFFRIFRPEGRDIYPGEILAGAINSTVPVRFRKLKSKAEISYRFCEFNPNDTLCQQGFGYGERYRELLGYQLARRIVSTPEFVNGVCSQSVPVIKWYIRWHQYAATYMANNWIKNLDLTLNQLDESLSKVYGDGTWNSSSYRAFSTDRTQEFIFRRYLDGGPRVVSAMRDCLNQIRTEIGIPLVIPTNPNAADVFSAAINFQEVGFIKRPTHKIVIQSRRFTKESVAQITRLIENAADLPPVRDFPDSGYGLKDALALTSWMSAADSKYDYRVITHDELQETLPNMAGVCSVNRDYLLYGSKGLKLLPKENQCDLTKLILVRVLK